MLTLDCPHCGGDMDQKRTSHHGTDLAYDYDRCNRCGYWRSSLQPCDPQSPHAIRPEKLEGKQKQSKKWW